MSHQYIPGNTSWLWRQTGGQPKAGTRDHHPSQGHGCPLQQTVLCPEAEQVHMARVTACVALPLQGLPVYLEAADLYVVCHVHGFTAGMAVATDKSQDYFKVCCFL